MAEKMKAAVVDQFGSAEEIRIREMPKPSPGEGEVLVRISAAGINPVDWKIRSGILAGRGIPHELPVILGWDMAGTVEGLGFGARRFSPGDEVYGFCRRPVISRGCYAEYISIPENYITRRPATVDLDTASAMPLASLTAWQSVYSAAEIKEGETALIIGATGGVGSYAVQFCSMAGVKTVAVASGRNRKYAEDLGAYAFIDYTQEDLADAVNRICPGGADFVFDCRGGDALQKAYACTKKSGRLVSIVQPPDRACLDERGAEALYVFVEPNVRQLDHISLLADSGQLKTTISRVFTLEETPEAHEILEAGHTLGKMIIQMS